ncbi:MAG: glycosyl hydrolase family protein [Verrucomicrobiota bacterium]
MPIPKDADIDQLFAFAKATDAKVIYSFRLHNGDAAQSASQAQYIAERDSANLLCFSIGNEPDIYVHSWPGYRRVFEPIYDAINQAVPDAKYCGPSLTSNARPWAHDFAAAYAPGGRIVYVGQHEYAGGAGEKQKDPARGRDLMLSPGWHAIYQTYYDRFVPGLNGVPYRLEEANNFYNGGAKDVSDTFASALWGLDYLYWWAAHGSQGINFHNGDEVAAGQNLTPCRYASFTSVADGYFAHPLAYAIKLFTLGAHGKMVPAQVTPSASAADLNLVAYAALDASGALDVTLINKEHDAGARDADVTLNLGAGPHATAQSIALTAPNGDVAAQVGVTLGGAPLAHDGTWKETWTDLPAPIGATLTVHVPGCSALLVRVR